MSNSPPLSIRAGMKPSHQTLEAFFEAIPAAAMQFANSYGWNVTDIRRVCKRTWQRIDPISDLLNSDELKVCLDQFSDELVSALPAACRNGSSIETGSALHHLAFASTITLQHSLLAKIVTCPLKQRPVLSEIEATLCMELVLLWRHSPWFVAAINAAQPELEYPDDFEPKQRKEDDKSVSSSLLEPSA